MSAKETVKAFYNLDLAKESNALKMVHKDCVLHWNSSKGFTEMNYNEISAMLLNIRESFLSFKYKLSHLLEDGNTVTARYTVYTTNIETPFKEDALAHFISIWEVKNNKLYKGWEVSQLVDDNPKNISSYSEIKI